MSSNDVVELKVKELVDEVYDALIANPNLTRDEVSKLENQKENAHRDSNRIVNDTFKFFGSSSSLVRNANNGQLLCSKDFRKSLKKYIAKRKFPKKSKVKSLKYRLENGIKDAKAQYDEAQETILFQKELIAANATSAVYNTLAENYDKDLEELAAAYEQDIAIKQGFVESIRNNKFTYCLFNLFDKKEREEYYEIVRRSFESVRLDNEPMFTEDHLTIIKFFQLGKLLAQEKERASANMYMMQHMMRR